jgi:hypothetical protein
MVNADRITQSKQSINDYVNNPKIIHDASKPSIVIIADTNQSLPAEPVRMTESDLNLNHYQNNTIVVTD